MSDENIKKRELAPVYICPFCQENSEFKNVGLIWEENGNIYTECPICKKEFGLRPKDKVNLIDRLRLIPIFEEGS